MAIVERPEPAKRESAERPIRIFLNAVAVAVSQGSPFGLSELAVGYLLSEGLIADRDSLVEVVEVPEEAAVYVASGERAEEGYVPLHRVTSAGCAQSALLRDARRAGEPRALESAARFDADDLLACMEELCERSPRRNTGACVHGCGLGAAGLFAPHDLLGLFEFFQHLGALLLAVTSAQALLRLSSPPPLDRVRVWVLSGFHRVKGRKVPYHRNFEL